MIIDNFLSRQSFSKIRKLCDSAEFVDTKSPYDDVVYPDLVVEIPEDIKQEILNKLSIYHGEILDPIMFVRKSSEGVHAPHQVHSDTIMGDYSLFLYLNREENCKGGTGLVVHVDEFLYTTPENEYELAVLNRDTHNTNKWYTYDLLEMYPNRGAIMDANLLHRSEPVGGFGHSNKDSRMVLICFFKVNKDDSPSSYC